LSINGVAPGESSGLRVLLRPNDSAARLPAYAQVLMQRVTPVKADGTFSFPALYVGHYAVAVEGLARGMYVADVQQGGTSVMDSGISVTSQSPNPLQVSIKTDAGMLQGTVLDFQKRPSRAATVVVIPPENRRQNRMLYWTATTDADGKFAIPGVAPGNYKVFAWLNLPAGTYLNPRFVAKYEASGRTITIAPSAIFSTELTAIPLD
jgi:Carboxypeptidase regulatory-like domain